MKSGKLFLPAVILLATVLALTVCAVVLSIAKKPVVTEHDFPFAITYELDGSIHTIQDVYSVRYDRNDGEINTQIQYYVGKIGDMPDDAAHYTLRDDPNGRIELATNFHPGYFMGDPAYDSFEGCAPQLICYDAENNPYTDEAALSAHAVKLISYEYPTPIENTFVFSHISILDYTSVVPLLAISAAAWLVVLVFVKKDKEYRAKLIDVVTIVFHFLIVVILLPFITLCTWAFDAMGRDWAFLCQLVYFLPSLTLLGIAASIALRRKCYRISALVVQFVSPALFVVYLFAMGIFG